MVQKARKQIAIIRKRQNKTEVSYLDWDSTKVIKGTKFDILWHWRKKMLNASVLVTNPKTEPSLVGRRKQFQDASL
jgi:hypothetical protein